MRSRWAARWLLHPDGLGVTQGEPRTPVLLVKTARALRARPIVLAASRTRCSCPRTEARPTQGDTILRYGNRIARGHFRAHCTSYMRGLPLSTRLPHAQIVSDPRADVLNTRLELKATQGLRKVREEGGHLSRAPALRQRCAVSRGAKDERELSAPTSWS